MEVRVHARVPVVCFTHQISGKLPILACSKTLFCRSIYACIHYMQYSSPLNAVHLRLPPKLHRISSVMPSFQEQNRTQHGCHAHAHRSMNYAVQALMMHAGLPVDINTMDQGIFKAAFMRTIANVSPWLVPLIRIVKLWARTSALNDPTDGTLNSYCLTLLSIFHLQQLTVPQLPPIWQLLPEPQSKQISPPKESRSTDQLSQPAEEDSDSRSHSQQSQHDKLACSQQPTDKLQSSADGGQLDMGSQQQQRPPSTRRIMHKGARPPPDTEEKIQRKVSLWRSTLAPPPQQLSLENIALAFFVRLSAFLLARFRRYDDTCWRTVSTWSGTLFPCKIQKMKLQKVKGTVTKCMGQDGMSDDANQVVLLRELLRTLRRHWGKSGGCASACVAASARVLELAPLMVPEDDVIALREEFAVVSTGEEAEEAPQNGSGGARLRNGDRSGAGAGSGSWAESRAAKQKHMLEDVYQFLLRVPRSTRSNEKAAHDKKNAVSVDASSEGSVSEEDPDKHDQHASGQGSRSRTGEVDVQQALNAAQSALQSAEQPQVRNHVLEAKENDLILDMSSSEGDEDADEEEGEEGGTPAADEEEEGEEGTPAEASDESSGADRAAGGTGVFLNVPEESDHDATTTTATTSTERLEVVCAVVSGYADLPEAAGLSEELVAKLRVDDGTGTASVDAVLRTNGQGAGASVAENGASDATACAPPEGLRRSGAESDVAGAQEARVPVAAADASQSTSGTGGKCAGAAKRSQHGRIKSTRTFNVAVSSIQRNNSLPSAAQSLNDSVRQMLQEKLPDASRTTEEQLRVVCNQRLAALGCFLGVEDPFDESDNAARTLRHFDRLLAHALLPVIYGTDALACCLREPPPADATAGAAQSAQDDVRHACNVMQRFEHPIQQDSEERRKIDSLAMKWKSGTQPPGDVRTDSNDSKKLRTAHYDALKRCDKDLFNGEGAREHEYEDHVRDLRGHPDDTRRNNLMGAGSDRDFHRSTTPTRYGHQAPPPSFRDKGAFPTLSPGRAGSVHAPQPHPHSHHGNCAPAYHHHHMVPPPGGWPNPPQGRRVSGNPDRAPPPPPQPQGYTMHQQQPPSPNYAYVRPQGGGQPVLVQLPQGVALAAQDYASGPQVQVVQHRQQHRQHQAVQHQQQHQHGPTMGAYGHPQFLSPAAGPMPTRSGSHTSGGTPVSVQDLFTSQPQAGSVPQQPSRAPSAPYPTSSTARTQLDVERAKEAAESALRGGAESSARIESHQERWGHSDAGAPVGESSGNKNRKRNQYRRGRGGGEGSGRGGNRGGNATG